MTYRRTRLVYAYSSRTATSESHRARRHGAITEGFERVRNMTQNAPKKCYVARPLGAPWRRMVPTWPMSGAPVRNGALGRDIEEGQRYELYESQTTGGVRGPDNCMTPPVVSAPFHLCLVQ